MRLLLVAAFAAWCSMGCATTAGDPPASAEATPDSEFSDGSEAATADVPFPTTPAEPEPRAQTYRLGFWELDLFAYDVEPRGNTFRLLDIRIFKLLEFGMGENYHSFRLLEIPPLLNLFATTKDGLSEEHRLADLRALDLAMSRYTVEGPKESELDFFRFPLLGSAYGLHRDGPTEHRTILYLLRQELER